jgi:hypothetical protein
LFTINQLIVACGTNDLVAALKAVEADFKYSDALFNKLYKPLTKPGIKKRQIFSCAKPDNIPLQMYFWSSNLFLGDLWDNAEELYFYIKNQCLDTNY